MSTKRSRKDTDHDILQDWPSSADFQSAYPKLYNDFCDSLPVPDYTKRNGVLNLYSHVSAANDNRIGD